MCPSAKALQVSWAWAAKRAAWWFLLLVQGIFSSLSLENTWIEKGELDNRVSVLLPHCSPPLCVLTLVWAWKAR